MHIKGRLTGMSSLLFGIISFDKKQFFWKLTMLCGMIVTSSFVILHFNKHFQLIDTKYQMVSKTSLAGYCIAGFLVGFGSKLGHGCTSGHGLCGLPRLSKRSFVAVGTCTYPNLNF